MHTSADAHIGQGLWKPLKLEQEVAVWLLKLGSSAQSVASAAEPLLQADFTAVVVSSSPLRLLLSPSYSKCVSSGVTKAEVFSFFLFDYSQQKRDPHHCIV